MAAVYNIPTQYNGDTFEQVTFNFYTTSADVGNEIDLSTATPKMDIRRDGVRGKVVKQLTIGSGLEWVDQANGQLRTTAFLIDWGGGKYVYDLQITYTATDVQTYVKGSFTVTEDVTD
jgi:hypothetical protein